MRGPISGRYGSGTHIRVERTIRDVKGRRSRSSQRRKSGSRTVNNNNNNRPHEKRFTSKERRPINNDEKKLELDDGAESSPGINNNNKNSKQQQHDPAASGSDNKRGYPNRRIGIAEKSAYFSQSNIILIRRDRAPKMYINVAKEILKTKHDEVEIHGAGEIAFFNAIKVIEVSI